MSDEQIIYLSPSTFRRISSSCTTMSSDYNTSSFRRISALGLIRDQQVEDTEEVSPVLRSYDSLTIGSIEGAHEASSGSRSAARWGR
ncbi:hypothetical protein NKR23_g7317 [Pleurostoma richardsiae]|uniref:Uncharacterized protein n=1 Tax=Pleurostoma richardsiae TaxID=41990 RepID=A0AA38RWL7_9PEZI|nr:hypothetical protein NKR23_g7317 [Pleurostoma richardsiae]